MNLSTYALVLTIFRTSNTVWNATVSLKTLETYISHGGLFRYPQNLLFIRCPVFLFPLFFTSDFSPGFLAILSHSLKPSILFEPFIFCLCRRRIRDEFPRCYIPSDFSSSLSHIFFSSKLSNKKCSPTLGSNHFRCCLRLEIWLI